MPLLFGAIRASGRKGAFARPGARRPTAYYRHSAMWRRKGAFARHGTRRPPRARHRHGAPGPIPMPSGAIRCATHARRAHARAFSADAPGASAPGICAAMRAACRGRLQAPFRGRDFAASVATAAELAAAELRRPGARWQCAGCPDAAAMRGVRFSHSASAPRNGGRAGGQEPASHAAIRRGCDRLRVPRRCILGAADGPAGAAGARVACRPAALAVAPIHRLVVP